MSKIPEISAVICTRNRASMLADCINSLLNQNIDSENFEILIVDNNSTDNTKEIAAEFCKNHNNIKYLFEQTAGYSAPRNCGWKNASGKFVAYIDDDEIAAPNWIESILNTFQIEENPDIIGGIYDFKYDEVPPEWFFDLIGKKERMSKGLLNKNDNSYFWGGNIAFKKEILGELGGFSNDFNMKNCSLMMGEDTDICHRAKNAGLRLFYNPEIVIYHRMTSNDYDIERRKEKAKKKGMSTRFIFGRKPFFSHHFRHLTYFSMILADFFMTLFSKKLTTKSVLLKEKIAYRKGYFEMDKKLNK